jgi:hypothetical protein
VKLDAAPQDRVEMHSFENGNSTTTKRDNWWQIQKFCKKWRGESLPEQLVEDTMNVRALLPYWYALVHFSGAYYLLRLR